MAGAKQSERQEAVSRWQMGCSHEKKAPADVGEEGRKGLGVLKFK